MRCKGESVGGEGGEGDRVAAAVESNHRDAWVGCYNNAVGAGCYTNMVGDECYTNTLMEE